MPDMTEYKCPSCGAPMKFDISSQHMVCSFCSNDYDLEYIRSNFKEVTDEKLSDFDWVERTKFVWEPDEIQKLAEYSCPSCGNNILTGSASAVANCPFCGHDIIISANFEGDIRPDKVIPFKKTAKDLADAYRRNISHSRYIPKEFLDKNVTDKIIGLYIPLWLYSCSCSSTDKDHCTVKLKIKDYPIPGTQMDRDLFYIIEPFDYAEAEDFTGSCLTGFYASRYTIGAESAMKAANEDIKKLCADVAATDPRGFYDPRKAFRDCVMTEQELTYYLVPIWLMKIRYRGGSYTFAMNGQTGEFTGSRIPYNRRHLRDYLLIYLLLMIITLAASFLLINSLTDDKAFAFQTTILLPGFFGGAINLVTADNIQRKLFKNAIASTQNEAAPNIATPRQFVDGDIYVSDRQPQTPLSHK